MTADEDHNVRRRHDCALEGALLEDVTTKSHLADEDHGHANGEPRQEPLDKAVGKNTLHRHCHQQTCTPHWIKISAIVEEGYS